MLYTLLLRVFLRSWKDSMVLKSGTEFIEVQDFEEFSLI